jgi:hypothetical protein
MPKICIICNAVASSELQLHYCDACQSALYCSKACQKIDWREKQHRQICKFLNVGHGDRQLRDEAHMQQSIALKEAFEEEERSLNEGVTRFFELFTESTFEGSRAAAQKMKKFAKRQRKLDQKSMMYHSLRFLARFSKSEMLSWPNSPLLVLLQLVGPNLLFGAVETSPTLLHLLADLADPFDISTHVNQLILAKQLIERGANVNTAAIPQGMTPLHRACYAGVVTNLDFLEFLLKAGADSKAQNYMGLIPLMCTLPHAPGAAKFLLKWPTTDANITARTGASFLAGVRSTVTHFSYTSAHPDNPDQVQDQLLLQQWRDIEEMLVERGAVDTGITAFH